MSRNKVTDVNSSDFDTYLRYRRPANYAFDLVSGKKWFWVPSGEVRSGHQPESYLIAELVDESDPKAWKLKIKDETTIVTFPPAAVNPVNPLKDDGVEDCAMLGDLSQPSVLHNLKLRYFAKNIYTYSGLFTVAVNPYQWFPIYTEEVVQRYKHRQRTEVPPHVYASADQAYRYLLKDKKSQSMLVTGESGAGKTENTKRIIQYLALTAGREPPKGEQRVTLEDQLLQANPLLEALGNAKTIKNINSSRFGKFIKITFDAMGAISGASINSYLLETSRVVKQGAVERSFHIFYQMITSMTPEQKQKYKLTNAKDFKYLNPLVHSVPGVDDEKDWKATLYALKILGFNDTEQDTLFRTVAGLLHLGNVEFVDKGEDQTSLKDKTFVESASELWKVDPKMLEAGLVHPTITVKGDRCRKHTDYEDACNSRDALAKAIYGRLFLWVVEKINQSLKVVKGHFFIGLLDIAGFEIFDHNSFEQLCINFTNERLQQFFNNHMFKLEQEEYRSEGIEWTFMNFGINSQMTIDLISKPPHGILKVLDDTCISPASTDQKFVDNLAAANKSHPCFNIAQGRTMEFAIKHYAGTVTYQGKQWIEKNRDPLQEDLTLTMNSGSDPILVGFWKSFAPQATSGSSFQSVGHKYKNQLEDLMAELMITYPHFIRCIIPNHQQISMVIDDHIVLDQLACNGVLEGIKISRMGFPNRTLYKEFFERYYLLDSSIQPRTSDYQGGTKKIVAKLVRDGVLDPEKVRYGRTKIFFRTGEAAKVETTREQVVGQLVGVIQALGRGLVARKIHHRIRSQKSAIVVIQNAIRQYFEWQAEPWVFLYARWRDPRWRKILLFENMADTQKAILDGLKKKQEDCEASIQAMKDQMEKLEFRKRDLEIEISHSKETYKEAEDSLNNMKNENRSLVNQNEQMEKKRFAQQMAFKEQQATANSIQTKMENLKSAQERSRIEIDRYLDALSQGNQLLNGAHAQLDELQAESRRLAVQISSAETELSENKDLIRESQMKIGALTKGISTLASDTQVKKIERKALKDAKSAAESKRKELTKEHEALIPVLQNTQRDRSIAEDLGKQLEQQHKSTVIELENEIAKSKTLKQNLAAANARVEQLTKDLEVEVKAGKDLTKKLTSTKKEISNANDFLEATQVETKNLATSNTNKEATIKSLTAELEEAKKLHAKLIKEVSDLNQAILDKKGRLDALEIEIGTAERLFARQTQEKAELENGNKGIAEGHQKFNKNKEKLEGRIKAFEESLLTEKEKVRSYQLEIEQSKAQALTLKQKLEEESKIHTKEAAGASRLPPLIQAKESEIQEATSHATEVNAKISNSNKKKSETLSALETLKEEKENLTKIQTEHELQKATLNMTLEEHLENFKRAADTSKQLERDIDDLKLEILKIQNLGSQEEKKFNQLNQEVNSKKESLAEIKKKISAAERNGDDLAASLKQQQKIIEEKTHLRDKQTDQSSAHMQKIENLKDKIKDLETSVQESEKEKVILEHKIQEVEQELEDEKRYTARFKAQKIELEEAILAEEDNKSQSVLEEIAKQAYDQLIGEVRELQISFEANKKERGYLELATRDIVVQVSDTQDELVKLQNELALNHRERQNIAHKQAFVQKQLSQLEVSNAILEKKVETKEKKAEKEVKISKMQLRQEATDAESIEAKLSELREDIRTSKNENKINRRAFVFFERQEASLSIEVAHLKHSVRDTKAGNESLKRFGEQLVKEKTSIEEEQAAASEIVEAMNTIIADKETQSTGLREQISKAKSEHDTILEQYNKLKKEAFVVQTDLQHEKAAAEHARRQMQRAIAQLHATADETASSSGEAALNGVDSKDAIKRQIIRANKAIKKLTSRLTTAIAERDTQDAITDRLRKERDAVQIEADNMYNQRVISQKELETLHKLVFESEQFQKVALAEETRAQHNTNELSRQISAIQDALTDINDKNAKLENASLEVFDTKSMEKELEHAALEHDRVKQEYTTLELIRKKLRRELADERLGSEEAAFLTHKLETKLDQLRTELLVAKSTNSATKRSLAMIDDSYMDTQKSLAEHTARDSKDSTTHRLREQIDAMTGSLEQQKAKTEATREKTELIEAKCEELEFDLKTLRSDIARLHGEARRHEKAAKEFQHIMRLRQAINDQVEEEWDRLGSDAEDYEYDAPVLAY